jgi:hypothetical protein
VCLYEIRWNSDQAKRQAIPCPYCLPLQLLFYHISTMGTNVIVIILFSFHLSWALVTQLCRRVLCRSVSIVKWTLFTSGNIICDYGVLLYVLICKIRNLLSNHQRNKNNRRKVYTTKEPWVVESLFVWLIWIAGGIFQLSGNCHHNRSQGCKFRPFLSTYCF